MHIVVEMHFKEVKMCFLSDFYGDNRLIDQL